MTTPPATSGDAAGSMVNFLWVLDTKTGQVRAYRIVRSKEGDWYTTALPAAVE
jgi:hypothetical protein